MAFGWLAAMMTSSNGNIFRVTGLLCGELTGHRWIPLKGQWRGTLMFSLICAGIKGWVNNREAGDLRRHRAHYDVTVMTAHSHLISAFASFFLRPPPHETELTWHKKSVTKNNTDFKRLWHSFHRRMRILIVQFRLFSIINWEIFMIQCPLDIHRPYLSKVPHGPCYNASRRWREIVSANPGSSLRSLPQGGAQCRLLASGWSVILTSCTWFWICHRSIHPIRDHKQRGCVLNRSANR